ncbi:Protein ACTIVITY OF BC1 COMPLEX KINASE 3, chloroplastic [Linum grandiflorum]
MNYEEGCFAEVIEEFKRMGSAGICCTDGGWWKNCSTSSCICHEITGRFEWEEWVVCGGVEATLQDESSCSRALQNFFDDALNYTVGELNFKTLVDGLGAVFYQYPFNVPAYYALILRSLPVLEGLALNADPNFKVLAASYPDFAKRLLTYPNPYLRDALIELLFKDGRFRWKRLENLLVQGSEDRDFSARDALQRVLKLLLGEDGDFYRPLQILIRPFCSLYYRQSGWTCHWRSNATFDGCSPELVALGWWSNF